MGAGETSPAAAETSPAAAETSPAAADTSAAAASGTSTGSPGTAAEPPRLRKSLGVASGAGMIVGVIVGSGVFVSPRGVLAEAGSPGAALLVWAVCGLFTMLGALCFAELGTSVLASGGEYTYIRLAYGPQLGFLYLWLQVAVVVPCSSAISALTFADYLLQPLYADCEAPRQARALLALALLLLLVYLNGRSVRQALRLQNSFTAGKLLALGLIVALGLRQWLAGAGAGQLARPWEGGHLEPGRLARAFYAAYYTYAGWNALNFVTEEMRRPQRDMPRAILLSIAGVTSVYLLANGAYLLVLTRAQMLGSGAIAVTFGLQALPAQAAWLMPLLVALSTLGGLNGSIFSTARMYYAGARQGQLPAALQLLHLHHRTPLPSLLLLGLTSALYLFVGDVLALISYTVFVEALLAAAGVSTVLALRHQLPQLRRPFKVPLPVPVAYLLFSLLLVALPIWQAPREAALGLAILLLGLPVYWLALARGEPAGPAPPGPLLRLVQRLTMSA